VVGALQQLGDAKSRGELSRRLRHELDGRVARRIREALRDMGESGAKERKRVNDELETVRGELSELKTRLARLEIGTKQPNGASDSGAPGAEPSVAPTRKAKTKPEKSAKPRAAPSDRAQRAVAHGSAEKAAPVKRAAKASKSAHRKKTSRPKAKKTTPRRRKILDERGSR
jgi:hypothetical protein